MSEEELNINYIREKTGLVENDELIPIILEMIKDSYKAGLCQSEFDNTMGLIEENQELKDRIKDLELIVGTKRKRSLISKFNKEYDEEDKKKNPNRTYTRIEPDAEEIYKRYYDLKKQLEEIREYIQKNKLYTYKYDEEELFEITTDEVAKTDLLQILDKGGSNE